MKQVSPVKISEGIAAALNELGLGKKIKQYDALNVWSEVVGEQIAAVTEPERVAGGKLFVRVSRSTWRNELTFLKKEIIERLNAKLGAQIVNDIIFR